jgi:hypothetical protein
MVTIIVERHWNKKRCYRGWKKPSRIIKYLRPGGPEPLTSIIGNDTVKHIVLNTVKDCQISPKTVDGWCEQHKTKTFLLVFHIPSVGFSPNGRKMLVRTKHRQLSKWIIDHWGNNDPNTINDRDVPPPRRWESVQEATGQPWSDIWTSDIIRIGLIRAISTWVCFYYSIVFFQSVPAQELPFPFLQTFATCKTKQHLNKSIYCSGCRLEEQLLRNSPWQYFLSVCSFFPSFSSAMTMMMATNGS